MVDRSAEKMAGSARARPRGATLLKELGDAEREAPCR